MRILIACEVCDRQFDSGVAAPGAKFHCTCGNLLRVPDIKAKDAAVVRCSACGAARQKGSLTCEFCMADFTLHEQDMHTICASCMTRVSDKARFCHHCGKPIVADGTAGEATEKPCPACKVANRGKRKAPQRLLNSRSVGEPPVSMLECLVCAGIWIPQETFELFAEQARDKGGPTTDASSLRLSNKGTNGGGRSSRASAGVEYRRCVRCDQLMNRYNFARQSGVIVDICRDHGIWFDAGELDDILRWIRTGGERKAARKDEEARRQAERGRHLERATEMIRTRQGEAVHTRRDSFLTDLFGSIILSRGGGFF